VADNKAMGVGAVLVAPILVIGTVLGSLLLGADASAACNPTVGSTPSVSIDIGGVPAGPIAGYSGVQLVNAAHIIQAGTTLGLGLRDQTIGVMTAMGESGLTVIDHGDIAGPDSRGLFQQRAVGWGSLTDRMNPAISATNFFKAMMGISDRESLEPTIVAHRTQRNADPYHYVKYWDSAVAVVEGLAGVKTGLAPGTGEQVCNGSGAAPGTGTVTDGGWASPGAGPISSRYGMREDPVSHAFTRLHAGDDLQAGGCDGPIWAAHDGTVSFAGILSDGTGMIAIDHGAGVTTRYLHEYASGILVRAGDDVSAGQQVGRVGNTGNSTGCHLHFEVMINGKNVDPSPFMTAVGITLGQ
jgi:murein DD-endopeptidase MepM/ murein hydrolase activator NlpD